MSTHFLNSIEYNERDQMYNISVNLLFFLIIGILLYYIV